MPTGTKFVNSIGTMWKGKMTFESPMLWAMGFLVTFLLGGLTGVLLGSPALDFHLNDTYFVVAHFHYVLFGKIVFATFAGIYFWFPKITGRMMDETLPRRYVDYLPTDDFTVLHAISSIGAFVLGASTLPFLWDVFKSDRYGRVVTADDPWGFGNSLEWATSCPPPRHNFTELPRVRSECPAFELHYPAAAPVACARPMSPSRVSLFSLCTGSRLVPPARARMPIPERPAGGVGGFGAWVTAHGAKWR